MDDWYPAMFLLGMVTSIFMVGFLVGFYVALALGCGPSSHQ